MSLSTFVKIWTGFFLKYRHKMCSNQLSKDNSSGSDTHTDIQTYRERERERELTKRQHCLFWLSLSSTQQTWWSKINKHPVRLPELISQWSLSFSGLCFFRLINVIGKHVKLFFRTVSVIWFMSYLKFHCLKLILDRNMDGFRCGQL